jgi:endoglycosylceramidase
VDRVLVIGRVLIPLLVVLLALITYPGEFVVSMATLVTQAPPAPAAPRGVLPWLHVAHPEGGRAFIADDQNRMVILHGAIPASLVQYGPGDVMASPIDPAAYADGRCPATSAGSPYPPLCQTDLERMAALGFNSVRLPISWSVLEPERGRFDEIYLDRVAQVVSWARRLAMYVIVDMHQNAYSHYVGAGGPNDGVKLRYNDGAPAWATITDGLPSHVYRSQRELNPAVFAAATNFWYDRDGIQDAYIAAFAHVVRRFKDDSTVAGFGVYNEPWFGWNLPPGFDDLLLFPFYRRVIDAVTGARDGLPCWSGFFMPASCGYRDLGVDDSHHLLFIDTGVLREIADFPTHLGLPISSYPNLVLALHPYTHIYTPDALLGQHVPNTTYPWGGYDQGWDWAEREARAMGMALFAEEFGSNPEDDGLILSSQLLEEEKHRSGFAFWTWTEISGNWGMYDSSTRCLLGDREQTLARAYPRVTADPSAIFHYDQADGSFTMRAFGRSGDPATVVYVPREVTGNVSSTGAVSLAVTADEKDGSRLAVANPTGGRFTIQIAPAPLQLRGCSS